MSVCFEKANRRFRGEGNPSLVILAAAYPFQMVSDTRVTYRRRHSYNTASNSVSVVKTPGWQFEDVV